MSGDQLYRVFAAVAVLLGAGAVVAGDPHRQQDREAYVSSVVVAEWLRDRKPFQLIDVREQNHFNEFHLPRALHVVQSDLGTIHTDSAGTIVVYSDENRRAWRAKRELEKLGHDDVRILDGGVRAWLFEIISPTVSRNASWEEREAFARVAELSRYFGGMPRVVDGTGDQSNASTASMLEQSRRRGCSF